MEAAVVFSSVFAVWYFWEAAGNAGHFAEAFCWIVAPPPPNYG